MFYIKDEYKFVCLIRALAKMLQLLYVLPWLPYWHEMRRRVAVSVTHSWWNGWPARLLCAGNEEEKSLGTLCWMLVSSSSLLSEKPGLFQALEQLADEIPNKEGTLWNTLKVLLQILLCNGPSPHCLPWMLSCSRVGREQQVPHYLLATFFFAALKTHFSSHGFS